MKDDILDSIRSKIIKYFLIESKRQTSDFFLNPFIDNRKIDIQFDLTSRIEELYNLSENEFNKLRASAFQKAYFEKDNNSSSGSKGDFIYKENELTCYNF